MWFSDGKVRPSGRRCALRPRLLLGLLLGRSQGLLTSLVLVNLCLLYVQDVAGWVEASSGDVGLAVLGLAES